MKNTKFLVKVNRAGKHTPQYVESIGKSVATTSDRKRALVMGKFAAEDAIIAIQNARCTPELIRVKVSA
ncbi:MAG TPA: hypothetical protein VMT53_13595 [Terriglobales bacterium]|nr:hypothetical protein [Terriglobales bacterium]